MKLLSHVRFFVTPWTVAHQAPPSMAFCRQDIEPGSPALRADALLSRPAGNPISKTEMMGIINIETRALLYGLNSR